MQYLRYIGRKITKSIHFLIERAVILSLPDNEILKFFQNTKDSFTERNILFLLKTNKYKTIKFIINNSIISKEMALVILQNKNTYTYNLIRFLIEKTNKPEILDMVLNRSVALHPFVAKNLYINEENIRKILIGKNSEAIGTLSNLEKLTRDQIMDLVRDPNFEFGWHFVSMCRSSVVNENDIVEILSKSTSPFDDYILEELKYRINGDDKCQEKLTSEPE